MDVMIEV